MGSKLIVVFGGIRLLWKVVFFAWSATLGKKLTKDILRKQHVMVVVWCCMCKKSGESMDHLLHHCEMVSALWMAWVCLIKW